MSTDNQTATVTYKGVVITYYEIADDWRYTFRGRERRSKTLALAKVAIDIPEKQDKPAFTRIRAWKNTYSGWKAVDVTSHVENSSSYRYVEAGGERGTNTERGDSLYPKNPENDAKVTEIMELKKQIGALQTKALEVEKTMSTIAQLEKAREEAAKKA